MGSWHLLIARAGHSQRIAAEAHHGMIAQTLKDRLFNPDLTKAAGKSA